MKKNVLPRYFGFLLLSSVIFVLLVIMQFTHQGNFSHRIGEMQISGRFFLEEGASAADLSLHDLRPLQGEASVLFGGLEFRLASMSGSGRGQRRGAAERGFFLTNGQGESREVFPQYVSFLENEAVFVLPGGTRLSFATTEANPSEIRISASFSEDVSTIDIPFRPKRSSVILRSGENNFGISFNGNRYGFSRNLQGIEAGRLILSSAAPSIFYSLITDRRSVNPEHFFVSQAATPQAFSQTLSQWTNENFALWVQNIAQADEDMVVAWASEALVRGVYSGASSLIPASFSNSPARTWESSVFQFDRRVGVWAAAVAPIVAAENERTNRITRLLGERDTALFAERDLIHSLAIRNLNQLIDNIASFAGSIEPSSVTLEMSPGVFESRVEFNRRRPDAINPFDSLAEAANLVVAEKLFRDGDRVFVFADGANGTADLEFNLRLGAAIEAWAGETGREYWTRVGRSLVFSVLSSAADGFAPASMTMSAGGTFVPSSSRVSSARLYRLLGRGEHVPRWIPTGIDGILAYTAASAVNITRTATQMDILVDFPAGETHYLLLTNIDPFPLLQIYGQNWRTAVTFESYYNAPGWIYLPAHRVLVLKLRHRTQVEPVRILFTVPPPPPPPPSPAPPPPSAPPITETPPPVPVSETPYEG